MRHAPLVALAAGSVLIVGATLSAPANSSGSTPRPRAVVGDAQRVVRAYDAWRLGFENGPAAGRIALPLRWSKGLCTTPKRIPGRIDVELDVLAGRAHVTAVDLTEPLDLWLVENLAGKGRSVAPEAGDRCQLLATVAPDTAFELDLRELHRRGQRLDLLVATEVGKQPHEDVRLTAMAGLFPRLYLRDAPTARRGGGGLPLAVVSLPLPTVAPVSIPDLVAFGEFVFFNETFEGNGRTCGTCHPAENNLTLDATFIATLDPNDPLFVAEYMPALDSNSNGGLFFENPALMHELGLIVVNADGFDDLKNRFVMRSVSHVFAQDLQRTTPIGQPVPPAERLGWSGDGSPASGTLRDFAVGAVTQHFPLTLARQPGEDFRLPTEDELDGLEAFQLSLGRDSEYAPLADPGFQFTDPLTDAGRTHLQLCGVCHFNGGANSFFVIVNGQPNDNAQLANANFDTGVEQRLQALLGGSGEPRPFDGGFGLQHVTVPGFGEAFGDGTFNTPPLIEAADTVPSYHNHLTGSGYEGDPVEAAVGFYLSDEFLASPAGLVFGTSLTGDEDVKSVARCLRALNAIENAKASIRRLLTALEILQESPADEIAVMRALTLADADAEDGLQVLEPMLPEYNEPFDVFAYCHYLALQQAIAAVGDPVACTNAITEAIALLDQVEGMIATGF